MRITPLLQIITVALLGCLALVACQEAKKEEQPGATESSDEGLKELADKTLLGKKLVAELVSVLSLDDIKGYHLASQNALENLKTGERLEWSNENTGHSGTITPSRYYQTTQGDYCREFTQTLKLKQKQLETSGTACRNENKVWILQE